LFSICFYGITDRGYEQFSLWAIAGIYAESCIEDGPVISEDFFSILTREKVGLSGGDSFDTIDLSGIEISVPDIDVFACMTDPMLILDADIFG
jgi:hypothetical protein